MPDPKVLITCEHAVNHVPDRWAGLFAAHQDVLENHRGWDPGALELASVLAADLSAPCITAQVSRLLVDHNRSPHNRSLWSEYTCSLQEAEKESILKSYYDPFRASTAEWISERIESGDRVVHLSVHTFVPVLEGKVRDLDIGILYDPERCHEAFFADLWKAALSRICPELKVRFNLPYRGRSDCHQTNWRKSYPCRQYLGIELEVNQSLRAEIQRWEQIKMLISASLQKVLSASGSDE